MCHALAKNMLAGTGGEGVLDTPGLMSEGVECTNCHVEVPGRTKHHPISLKADTQTCVNCHEEGYAKMVAGWQVDYQTRLNHLEELYASLGLQYLSSSKRKLLGTLLGDAEYNLELIRKDGSRGAHNLDYINALADKTTRNLNYIQQEFSKYR